MIDTLYMLITFLKFSIFTTERVQIIFTNVITFNQLVFIDVQTHYTAPVLYIHRTLAAIVLLKRLEHSTRLKDVIRSTINLPLDKVKPCSSLDAVAALGFHIEAFKSSFWTFR